MEFADTNLVNKDLTRTGRRSGCSCCSFAFVGMVALPVLAVVSFFLVF